MVQICLIPFLFSCSGFERIRRSEDVDMKLNAAFKYFDEKEYYKSAVLLDDILPSLKGQGDAEKASFYRAMSNFKQRQYMLSAYYFKDFYDTYQRSKYAEEALFMAAKSLFKDSAPYNLDQTSTTEALRGFQKFANRYPGSQFIEEVNALTDELNQKLEKKAFENAKLYYELGQNNSYNYKSAVVALAAFQRHFPNSIYHEEAAWFKLYSQYRLAEESVSAYRKERYLEAIDFYQNFVDKYPNSEYLKEAEIIYRKCLEYLEKHNS